MNNNNYTLQLNRLEMTSSQNTTQFYEAVKEVLNEVNQEEYNIISSITCLKVNYNF